MSVYGSQWLTLIHAVETKIKDYLKDYSPDIECSPRGKFRVEVDVIAKSCKARKLLFGYNPSLRKQQFSTAFWIDYNFDPEDSDCSWMLGIEDEFCDPGENLNFHVEGYDIFIIDSLEQELQSFLSFRVKIRAWCYRGEWRPEPFDEMLRTATKTIIDFLLESIMPKGKYCLHDASEDRLPKIIDFLVMNDDSPLANLPWCVFYS